MSADGWNLFLITGAGHQVVCALEAQETFGLDPARCALVGTPRVRSFGVIEPRDWARTYWPPPVVRVGPMWKRRLSVLRSARDTMRIARELGSIDNLVIGHYGEVHRHLSHVLRPRRTILLDDGTISLSGARDRALDLRGELDKSPVARASHLFKKHILRFQIDHITPLTFFSSYRIESVPGDEVVVNEYARIASRAKQRGRGEAAYFLGQPFYQIGHMRDDDYWRCVAGTRDSLGRDDFVYICHPSERLERVQPIVERFGARAVAFETPVEFALLDGELPAVVAGFFSSALVSCSDIYRGAFELKAFELPYELFNCTPAREQLMRELYEYFRTRGQSWFSVEPLVV